MEQHAKAINFSDSESEEECSSKHDELLSSISLLGRKRKKLNQRSEAAVEVSEHYLDPTDQAGVSVRELLKGFDARGTSLGALKSRLTLVENKNKPIAPPLSKVRADQLQRGIAYVETSKQASKWGPVVKKNRESAFLSFPLQEKHLPLPSLTVKVDTFKPETDFEKDIASLLASSDNVEDCNEELTVAEHQTLMKISLEKATERRKELQKMRALMSYYEQKSKRMKKIKSKRFHRTQRKKRELQASKQDIDENLLDKADRLRAQERMTLKHSRMSKWAKQQLARENRSDSVQEALSELHQKRQILKQKCAQKSGSDNSSEEEPEEDSSDVINNCSSNPWLGMSDVNKVPVKKHEKPGSLKTLQSGGEYIVTHSSLMVSESADSKLDQTVNGHLFGVQEAFTGDDVVGEFVAEKEKLIENSKKKVVDLSLPGWGTWGGQGTKPFKTCTGHMESLKSGKRRKDATIKDVIISEYVDKKVNKHLVNHVPWPYTSKEQFDKTHLAPLGRHWNTEATFQSCIKPRVTTAIGCVIEPIQLTDDVQEFIKRTSKAKNKTFNRR